MNFLIYMTKKITCFYNICVVIHPRNPKEKTFYLRNRVSKYIVNYLGSVSLGGQQFFNI